MRHFNDEPFTVIINGEEEGEIIADTGKAILVRWDDDGDTDWWVPESQIHEDSQLYSGCEIGDTGVLVISMWLARQKRLA